MVFDTPSVRKTLITLRCIKATLFTISNACADARLFYLDAVDIRAVYPLHFQVSILDGKHYAQPTNCSTSLAFKCY